MARRVGPEAGPRALALRTLVDYQRRDAYLGPLISTALTSSGLDRRDRALATELVQGSVRMKLSLDRRLSPFSRRPLEELEPAVAWALRLAAYQIAFTRVPAYAAVDATVEAAVEVAGRRVAGYTNAVLRAFLRGGGEVGLPDRDDDPAGYLEARYSHPRWIARMWIEELGLERAESLCSADNNTPAVSLRVNVPRCSRDELEAGLEEAGLHCEKGLLAPECLLLEGGGPVIDLPGYGEGLFGVQDQGAMLVAHAVAPEKGMEVLDMCAAPGGKANHLAELMKNEGRVLAVDVRPGRLALVRDSAERLGNTAVECLAADATAFPGAFGESFDRVLVDAPCSGLGTLARKPDARWRRRPGDIAGLAALQRRLLAEGARLVAAGGTLTYSTCTISRAENQEMAEWFLGEHEERFEPAVLAAPGLEGSNRVQLLPDVHGCDGTFVAVFRRRDR